MPAGHERLIRRAYRAFSERDLETLKRLASPEVEISTVTGLLAGHPEPYRGHEGIARYLEDTAKVWKRLELTPNRFIELSAEQVLVYGRVRAWRGRGFVDTANVWLWTIGEGRVASVQVFADPAEARRLAAGLGEDPRSGIEPDDA